MPSFKILFPGNDIESIELLQEELRSDGFEVSASKRYNTVGKGHFEEPYVEMNASTNLNEFQARKNLRVIKDIYGDQILILENNP